MREPLLAVVAEPLLAVVKGGYDPNEPRDDHGRWEAGSDANELADAIRSQHPGVSLELTDHGTHIGLDKIVAPESERNRGTGSHILDAVIRHANRRGIPVTLTPSGAFGGSEARLRRWYREHGFVKRPRSFMESTDELIRYPD